MASSGDLSIGDWRPVEIWATFVRVTGLLAVVSPQRLTDAVNQVGDWIEVRDAVTEPLVLSHPVLQRREEVAAVAKATVALVCPVGGTAEAAANPALWREKSAQAVSITTGAYTMVADVHLDPRRSLRDHLELHGRDFLPLTNVSALWIAGPQPQAVQRSLALLNPAAIVSFGDRPA
jgi:hypothetical protein